MKRKEGLLAPAAKKLKKGHNDPKLMVFIAPINHKTKMDTIIDEFGNFGDVKSVYLPLRRDGIQNIGFGNICFMEEVSAQKALNAGSIEVS